MAQENTPTGKTGALIWRIALIIAAYSIVVVVSVVMWRDMTLAATVTICKACSLAFLIASSGELALSIDRRSGRVVRYSNALILIFTTALFVVSLAKIGESAGLVLFQPAPTSAGWEGAVRHNLLELVGWLYHNSPFLSAIPIVSYALLNLYVMLSKARYSDAQRAEVEKHFWFNSVPCSLPLIWLCAIGVWRGRADEVEIFVGGGMSIIILLSSILAKAVDVFFGGEGERPARSQPRPPRRQANTVGSPTS